MTDFAYLFGVCIMLVPCSVLFYLGKNIRKEIILMSLLFGIMSLFQGYFLYTTDWWNPMTITGTTVGIEDFIGGIVNGGIISSIYTVFFNKKLKLTKDKESFFDKDAIIRSSIVGWTVLLIILVSFSILKINSFYSNVIGLSIGSIIIFYKRRDLINCGIISGMLIIIIAIPFYLITEILFPGFLSSWNIEKLSGILLFQIPIEDYIWYFFAGIFGSVFYKYYKNLKFIKR